MMNLEVSFYRLFFDSQGTDTLTDIGKNSLNLSNATNDHNSNNSKLRIC